jgi:hypothetical protein
MAPLTRRVPYLLAGFQDDRPHASFESVGSSGKTDGTGTDDRDRFCGTYHFILLELWK